MAQGGRGREEEGEVREWDTPKLHKYGEGWGCNTVGGTQNTICRCYRLHTVRLPLPVCVVTK